MILIAVGSTTPSILLCDSYEEMVVCARAVHEWVRGKGNAGREKKKKSQQAG